MTTDERRARAILVNSETGRGWDHATQTGRNVALGLARAIRESDEAAGMVLVPREALLRLLQNIEVAAPDADGIVWLKFQGAGTTGKGMFNLGQRNTLARQVALLWDEDRRAMIAAATEAENG